MGLYVYVFMVHAVVFESGRWSFPGCSELFFEKTITNICPDTVAASGTLYEHTRYPIYKHTHLEVFENKSFNTIRSFHSNLSAHTYMGIYSVELYK